MAARVPAVVRSGRQSVVVIDVAGNAGHIGMTIGEWKSGRAVIERCRRPTYCVVAHRTVRCHKLRTCRAVHRIIRLVPGRQMAARIPAIVQRGRQSKVVIDVARSAGHVGMPVGKWEPCYAVIEWRPCPPVHGVARRTLRNRKKRWSRGMRGVRGLLPSCQMAS
jgi:hypothetical protein